MGYIYISVKVEIFHSGIKSTQNVNFCYKSCEDISGTGNGVEGAVERGRGGGESGVKLGEHLFQMAISTFK